MPAAQIDVDIAENLGGSDKSGVGYLYPEDKSESHSRDGLGTNAAHNYDQPFYYQYIPATARPTDAAGSALRRRLARPPASTALPRPVASAAS